jgi:hypothetical protein
MPDESADVPKADTGPQKPDTDSPVELLKLIAARMEILESLPAQMNELSTTVDSRLKDLDRKFETVALDVNMMKENRRREAGLPPHREPVRPETETSGDGFGSYTWERKPATPRLS